MSKQNQPAAETPTNTPYVSVHRWPWRAEEFVSMLIVFAMVLGLGYLVAHIYRDHFSSVFLIAWTTFVLISAFGAVYYLYRVKKKRTDTSQVTITLIGDVIRSESKGPLGKSQVDVTKTSTIAYRKFNSDETFMITGDEQTVRVPVRATSDPKVRDAVERAFAQAEHVSAEAQDLHERRPAVKS